MEVALGDAVLVHYSVLVQRFWRGIAVTRKVILPTDIYLQVETFRTRNKVSLSAVLRTAYHSHSN